MSTLALRLAGAMQTWPAHSRGIRRPTNRAPTYSALSGMVGAALGIARSDSCDALADCSVIVRVDRAPRVMVDFHTINPLPAPDNRFTRERTDTTQMLKMSGGPYHPNVITHREYLADGSFICLVEGESVKVDELKHALLAPKWAIYLGRKSCPPGPDLVLGTFNRPAATVLTDMPVVTVDDQPSSVSREVHWLTPQTDLQATTETWIDQPRGAVGAAYGSRPRLTAHRNFSTVFSSNEFRQWVRAYQFEAGEPNHVS